MYIIYSQVQGSIYKVLHSQRWETSEKVTIKSWKKKRLLSFLSLCLKRVLVQIYIGDTVNKGVRASRQRTITEFRPTPKEQVEVKIF